MDIKMLKLICVVSFIIINLHSRGLAVFNKLEENNTAKRVKKQTNNCGSTLELPDCARGKPLTLSRREQNIFRANYEPGNKCNIIQTMFDWTIHCPNGTESKYEDYYNRDVFLLEPFMVDGGDYLIAIAGRERDGDTSKISKMRAFDDCSFVIKSEKPIPRIRGGPKRTAMSGEDLVISGEDSTDMDIPPDQESDLAFKWECTVTGAKTDFCDGNFLGELGYENIITIPASDAIHGAIYTVKLSVTTEDSDWESTKQIIHFKSDALPTIQIECLKNCPPHVQKCNSKQPTLLEAVCFDDCKDFKDRYQWTIDTPGFDYDASTTTGRNTDLFEIKENVLQEGETYTIDLAIRGVPSKWNKKIEVHSSPKLSSCGITPTSGEALTTRFRVNCEHEQGNYKFEIYSMKGDIGVLLTKGKKLDGLSFPLSVGSKAKVKMIDQYNFFDEVLLDVTVTSFVKTKGTDKDIEKDVMKKYFDKNSKSSMDNLLKSKDFNKALQVANSLTDDITALKEAGKDSVAKKFHEKVLDSIDNIPIGTGDRAKQLSALTTKITEVYSTKPDPDIAVIGTKICRKAGERMITDLEDEKFPGARVEDVMENVKVLSKCSKASATANLDVVTSEIETPEVSTPYPLIDVPVNTENYPDYEDDQNTSKAIKKLDATTNNVMELCYICSKYMSKLITSRDNTIFVESHDFAVSSTLRIGNRILSTKIESHGVTLVPSSEFVRSRSAVHIAMCVSTRNMFWWLLSKKILTSLAIVKFYIKEKAVSDVSKPFLLTFEMKENATPPIQFHDSVAPSTPRIGPSGQESDFENMSLYRITVYSRQSFFVEFTNLSQDVILNVAVESFYKPTLNEFHRKKQKVDNGTNKLFISNDNNYDSWYYLAILPTSSSGGNPPEYNFSVYTLACFSWSHIELTWKFACGSTGRSSVNLIICKCYHSSAFVGMVTNNEIKLEESLIEDLELETQASYVIFASVAAIFFLYCAFLTLFCVTGVDELRGEAIYFLSDIPSSYRYGYVLIVKTGNKLKASTTSNVTIKIYGTKSESKEHVLNYPDPEMKLLQKNEENWFFLATESCLGDIEKIDLWCDSIGFSPSWFCAEVEVFDIQQNKYWLFQINKWFDILINEEMAHTAFPTEIGDTKEKKVIAFRLLKRIKNSCRGAHMWNIMSNEEQGITRMKRLHIVYSIFLTTYVLALFFYGCPKLENSDSLSPTLNYSINKRVVFVTIGCFLLTFTMHFPIVWFFRYPKKDVLCRYKQVLKKLPIDTDRLCWLFLITNIVISMTLLIILGFWVPHITCLLWVTSVVISLLVYIFVMENIMRLILNFSVNQKERVQKVFEYIKKTLSTVQEQRIMMYKIFGPALLRPFFGHLYTPLSQHRIKEQKYWAERRFILWEIVEDLIMITIYVVLLYLVILMDRDINTYISHTVVRDLLRGTFSRTNLLEEAFHRKEMEDYINSTLIFSTQSLQWYGQYVWKNPGMTIDSADKYLGIVRLRQHRVMAIPCTVDFVDQPQCHPTYFWYPEFDNFSEGWKPDKYSNRFARMDRVWDYVTEWYSGSESHIGTFAVYPGGGYISTLGRTIQNSILNLNYLIRNQWIDHLSRCLFLEFLMYNPNNNLFNAVRIKFEMYSTGYIEHRLDITTAKLLFVKEEISIMFWIIIASFVVMLTIIILKLGFRLFHKKSLALKDIWHAIDIFIVVMSLVCLGLYVARSDVVRIFLLRIEKAKNNEFINYFHLMHTENSLTIAAAVLVFVSTLRLWKLMRFMEIVRVTEKTLLLSSRPLMALFLYQFLFTLACTFYGVVKYGSYDPDFRGVLTTIITLFIVSLNLYEEFDFDDISDTLGYIYYSLFMLVMLGIYTLYIAIVTFHYAEAQFYYSNKEEYNVANLVMEQCQYYKELIKIKWRNFRLRGGDDNEASDRKVYPKAEVFRYANCVMLPSNKMYGMSCVARCVMRNLRRAGTPTMADADVDLIKLTIVHLFREDTEDKEVFLMSNAENNRVRLIHDTVMLKMERIVEELFVTDAQRVEREERRKFCRKILKSHDQKMSELDESLNVLLNAISMVNIDV